MPIVCPNCQVEMVAAATESKYGAKVSLDQCPACGGIWLDGDEIYLAKHAVSDNYSSLDETKLRERVLINEKLACPRDGTVLEVFSDPNFPKSIAIEQCARCGGFWFNYGEFAAFQAERRQRQAEREQAASATLSKPDEIDQNIAKLLSSYGQSGDFESWGSLGRFLSRPVSPDVDTRGYSNAAMQVAQLLMRLFLR